MIRPALPADAETLEQIACGAYSKWLDVLLTPPDPLLLDYEAVAARGQTYVLEEGGEICGMVTCTSEPGVLVLRNLAVLPDRQGRGLGRELADFVEAEAVRRRHALIRLWTREEMDDNVRFYLALGYRITGRERSTDCSRIYFEKRLGTVNTDETEREDERKFHASLP